ncbi:MAG: zf-HC2 domain-containing protein [Acidobacteriota bacterium]
MPSGDRDRVVEQLLRTSAGDLLAAPAPDCLDAEILAAWQDGGLDATVARRIEGHLATCARCQAMAAAFVRAEVVPAPVPARAGWGLRWLVPVAATAAAAVAVWVFVPRQPAGSAAEQKVAMNEAAPAPVQAAPPSAPSTLASPDRSAAEAANTADGPRSTEDRQRADAKTETASIGALRDENAASNGGRGSLAQGMLNAPAAVPVPPPPAAVLAAAPVPPPPARGAAAAPPSPTPPAPAQVPPQRESVQVTAEAPLIQAQSGERSVAVTTTQVENLPVARGNFAELPKLAAASPASAGRRAGGAAPNNVMLDGISPTDSRVAVLVVAEFTAAVPVAPAEMGAPTSPAPAPAAGGAAGRGGALVARVTAPATRWRVLADGRVERSLTGGSTWDAMALDPATRVTGGVAPSMMVCWLIGTGGTVLRTTDRLHFERLPFPETVDLVVVQATSEMVATVITRDSRAFATADGGTTWRVLAR